jgi:hypothetical protein
MGGLMEVVRRLRALEAGRALPATSHLHVAIQPHALVVTPLVLAGEDTAIHIVAIGPIGRPPRLYSVPDPRRRDDVYRLFAWMAGIIEPYFQQCLGAETYPQVWVGSTPAARLLDILSDRIRFTAQHPTVQRLGLLLAYPAQRLSHGGQQTLMVATQALGIHFATGQDRSEDEHLGAQLAWILPPRGVPVLDAVAAAELRPAGVNTDPLFDKTTLMPLVAGYTHARRAKAPSAVLQRHAQAIDAALAPVARAIHHDVQRAIRVLQRDPRPPLPELTRLEEREAEEFRRYMDYIATGRTIPRRDKPFGAALTLAAREESLELAEAIARTSDRAARSSARLAGDILCGAVQNLQVLHPTPRRLVYQFEIVTSQRSARPTRCA